MPGQSNPRVQREIAALRVRLYRLTDAERRDVQAHQIHRNLSMLSVMLSRLALSARQLSRSVESRTVKRKPKALGGRLEMPILPNLPHPAEQTEARLPASERIRRGL